MDRSAYENQEASNLLKDSTNVNVAEVKNRTSIPGSQPSKVISEENDTANEKSLKETKQKVGLKRTVGLSAGISIIIGNMIGAGIFISPKSVLRSTESIGLCLIVWVLCGVVSLLGAFCYVELGTLITESGGELIYIIRGYTTLNRHLGRILAFLYAWSAAVILKPASFGVLTLASAKYILGPIIGDCNPPDLLVRLLAVLIMSFCVFINIYNAKLAGKVMVVVTFAKILALVVVIVGGIVRLCQGYTQNFNNGFSGSSTNIPKIASAFYGGLWAFDGWNNLNYVTEEIIKPKRNLPLSIFISVPLCTVIYLLVNISYFTVMSKDQLLASQAVAVTWSQAVLGKYFQWLLPSAIALSTFSSAAASIFSGSRLNYVAAREGLLIKVLAMVNVKRSTPEPSVIFTFVIAIIYTTRSEINDLIDIFSFTVWIFYGLAFLSVIIMRFTMKTAPRVIKLPIVLPIIMLILSIYFVISPVINDPKIDYLAAIGVLLAGLLFYLPFIHFRLKIPYFSYVTYFLQNLLQIALANEMTKTNK